MTVRELAGGHKWDGERGCRKFCYAPRAERVSAGEQQQCGADAEHEQQQVEGQAGRARDDLRDDHHPQRAQRKLKHRVDVSPHQPGAQ